MEQQLRPEPKQEFVQPGQKREFELLEYGAKLIHIGKENPLLSIPKIEAERKKQPNVFGESIVALWSLVWAASANAGRLRRLARHAKRNAKPRPPQKK